MQAEETSLAKFIGEKITIIIPVYQRNYDWRQAHCERLFTDIENIIENDKPHFLGTIVYQANEKGYYFSDYTIIDGQQRLTSVILLAKALYEVIDDSDIKESIQATFIKHSNGERKNQLKLKPSEYDDTVFQKLMNAEKFSSNNFDEQEKNSTLYINYVFFTQKILYSKYDPEKIYNALSQLKIVRILLQNENPQEIFESLNSTGLDLSNADLIRNYLLMALDYESQKNLYKKYWLEIELKLKSANAVENFIVQYLITKRRSDSLTEDNQKNRLSKNNLYSSFKKYFEKNYTDNVQSTNVENFLEDMCYYAGIYRKFIFNESSNFKELTPLKKKFYELTFLLDANNAPIILMYLYDRYNNKNFDEKTFLKFVEALISLAFRAKVCGFSGITSQFAGNVIARLDKNDILDEKIFWQALTFGKGKYAFPRDEEFKQALTTADLYVNIKSNGCKYFLYSLERSNFANTTFETASTLPPYSSVVVEHILPQRLNANWKKYLQDRQDIQAHEVWKETLGNLILVDGGEKSTGLEFHKKKVIASNSKFYFTKGLENYSEWTAKQIQARAKKLANVAVRIWTLPAEYNVNPDTVEIVFNLDADFGFFTGKKPSIVSIFNVEKKISAWRTFLIEFVKQLFALDSDVFRLATRKDNIKRYFAINPTKLLTPYKIAEAYYIETNLSTDRCLTIIKNLVENFDEISGTNFKDEIWFTLKK